jgi:TnpA family transposase
MSCRPREALYVLAGLLANNTIVQIRAPPTATHGDTESVLALWHLWGFYCMPRLRALKDQPLYRLHRVVAYGVVTPWLTKTADLPRGEEQWDARLRVALSLKPRTAPAPGLGPRLTTSLPADRLAQACTTRGRIIKPQYILR